MSGGPLHALEPVTELLVAQYDDALKPNQPDTPMSPGGYSLNQLNLLGRILAVIWQILGY